MWQPGGGLVETPKYKPKELLKNELGDKFEDFLYDSNIKLLEIRDEVKEKLKFERKIALSLNHIYTVSVIDKVLYTLEDKTKEK